MKLRNKNIKPVDTKWIVSAIGSICLLACQSIYKNDIQLQCRYMAYSCGDCYPQYQVTDVFNDSIAKQELLNKDISLEFEMEEQERALEQLQGNCAICFLYKFKGDIRYSFRRGYVLKVEDYNIEEENPKCCEK